MCLTDFVNKNPSFNGKTLGKLIPCMFGACTKNNTSELLHVIMCVNVQSFGVGFQLFISLAAVNINGGK